MDRLFDLMDESTCNFMAVDAIQAMLDANGFRELHEYDMWDVEPGEKCYVIKNGSAIFAFIVGTELLENTGARIISAHTDSPCFKLKPNCEIYGDGGVVSLNVEKYGGGIMYTWFDRPLSISGRVMLRTEDALDPISINIDLERPIATIPHLAIHFNRGVNEGNPLSVQKDMKPVVGYFSPEQLISYKSHGGLIKCLIAQEIKESVEGLPEKFDGNDILDYELCLYPVEQAHYVGVNNEYFQSGRIDDLSMAFAGLEALISESATPCEATRAGAV